MNNIFIVLLFAYQQNIVEQQDIVTILISAIFRGAALIRGETLIRRRRLFHCGFPEVCRLLEGSAYLRPDAYQRKYGKLSCEGKCPLIFYNTYFCEQIHVCLKLFLIEVSSEFMQEKITTFIIWVYLALPILL